MTVAVDHNLKLLYLIFPARPETWPPVQEKERLFGFGIDVDVVCEYSESVLLSPSAALARMEVTLTQLDVHAGVLGTVDRRTRDDFLWVPAGVKRQVRGRRI